MTSLFNSSLVLATAFVSSIAFAQSKPTTSTTAPAMPGAMHKTEALGNGENVQGSIKMAKVFFVEPKDGATVGETVKMKFGNESLAVAPAGKVVPGSGHYHVIVDEGAIKEGTVVPADAKHIHYGKGQTEAELKLTPGEHKLTLQFADGGHRSYGAVLSQTITVHVK